MNWLKRIPAVLVMIISVLIAIAGLIGIYQVWVTNASLTESLLNVFVPIDRSLARVEKRTGQVDTRVSATRERLANIQNEIKTRGQKIEETDLLLTTLEKTVGDDLAPRVDNLRQTVQGLVNAVEGIQSTIEAVNSIPLVSVPVPDLQALQNLSDTVDELKASVEEFRNDLKDRKAEVVGNTVERLNQPVQRIDGSLDRLQKGLARLDDRLAQTSEKSTQLQQQIPVWVDWASIILTIVLLWVILSQASLFIHGYYFFNGRNLLQAK